MRIEWFVFQGTPFIYVTAETRAMCMRLAFEIGAMLPAAASSISPRKDHKTHSWTQGFGLAGIDCEVAADAIRSALQVACMLMKSQQLTPPTGTPLSLIKETK